MSSILIAGAGPAGLALAACLRELGLRFRLIDRSGLAGGAYNSIYSGITLASPRSLTSLPGLPIEGAGEYVTVPEYRAYLHRYATHHDLRPERRELLRLEPGLVAHFADGRESYDAVAICTGMFDHPVFPDVKSGALHAKDWPGPSAFSGQRLLIVGAATSGVEIAEECARAGLRVTISAKGGRARLTRQRLLGLDIHHWVSPLERAPRWLLGSYCGNRPTLPAADLGFSSFVTQGLIRVKTTLVTLESEAARLRSRTGVSPLLDGQDAPRSPSVATFTDGSTESFDAVVFATGYRFDMPFLPPEVARAPAGHPLADEGESRSSPGLYFVGTPCARGLASEFLRGIRSDAPAVARRIAERLRRSRP